MPAIAGQPNPGNPTSGGVQTSFSPDLNSVVNALSKEDIDRITGFALSTIGRKPTTNEEMGLVLQGAFTPSEIASKGLTAFTGQLTPQAGLGLQTAAARSDMATATNRQAGYEREIVPSMRVLENALKIRSDVGQQPLGESQLFQAAGVQGFDALAASLNERMSEINRKSQSFQSVLADVGAQFGAQNQRLIDDANSALQKYSALQNEYGKVQDYLNQLELMKKENELALDLYTKKKAIDSGIASLSSSSTGALPGTDSAIGDEATGGMTAQQAINAFEIWYTKMSSSTKPASAEEIQGMYDKYAAMFPQDFPPLNAFRESGGTQAYINDLNAREAVQQTIRSLLSSGNAFVPKFDAKQSKNMFKGQGADEAEAAYKNLVRAYTSTFMKINGYSEEDAKEAAEVTAQRDFNAFTIQEANAINEADALRRQNNLQFLSGLNSAAMDKAQEASTPAQIALAAAKKLLMPNR